MKMLTALFFGFCLLSGSAARAEKIDFSTTTCKQFMEGHKESIGIILAWLDGYYLEEDDPPVARNAPENRSFRREEEAPLDCDLLVVDETSRSTCHSCGALPRVDQRGIRIILRHGRSPPAPFMDSRYQWPSRRRD